MGIILLHLRLTYNTVVCLFFLLIRTESLVSLLLGSLLALLFRLLLRGYVLIIIIVDMMQ